MDHDDFYNFLDQLIGEYHKVLAQKVTSSTISRHLSVVGMFREYIAYETDSIENITVGQANSKFYQFYYGHTHGYDQKTVKGILLKFFLFLETKGYHNPKVVARLKKGRYEQTALVDKLYKNDY